MACLTGLVTLTSTRIYDLHYSTYIHVPESISIYILRTVVLDYGELLAYWFISHPHLHPGPRARSPSRRVSGPPQRRPNTHSLLPMPQHCHQFPCQCTTPNTPQLPTSAAEQCEQSKRRCPPPKIALCKPRREPSEASLAAPPYLCLKPPSS